jgi:hypothetical protein
MLILAFQHYLRVHKVLVQVSKKAKLAILCNKHSVFKTTIYIDAFHPGLWKIYWGNFFGGRSSALWWDAYLPQTPSSWQEGAYKLQQCNPGYRSVFPTGNDW